MLHTSLVLSAEANMASGRVDAGPPKPFLPLNPGRVSLPLPLPPPWLSRPEVPLESLAPLGNV